MFNFSPSIYLQPTYSIPAYTFNSRPHIWVWLIHCTLAYISNSIPSYWNIINSANKHKAIFRFNGLSTPCAGHSLEWHPATTLGYCFNLWFAYPISMILRFGPGGDQEKINAICILALNIINDKVGQLHFPIFHSWMPGVCSDLVVVLLPLLSQYSQASLLSNISLLGLPEISSF